jgi:hypothetical protein
MRTDSSGFGAAVAPVVTNGGATAALMLARPRRSPLPLFKKKNPLYRKLNYRYRKGNLNTAMITSSTHEIRSQAKLAP